MNKLTIEKARKKWAFKYDIKMQAYNQAIVEMEAEADKMIDNKVMLQRAYGWIKMHYPSLDILTLSVEVIASYMARFAQEQIKSLKEEPK